MSFWNRHWSRWRFEWRGLVPVPSLSDRTHQCIPVEIGRRVPNISPPACHVVWRCLDPRSIVFTRFFAMYGIAKRNGTTEQDNSRMALSVKKRTCKTADRVNNRWKNWQTRQCYRFYYCEYSNCNVRVYAKCSVLKTTAASGGFFVTKNEQRRFSMACGPLDTAPGC